MELKMWKCFVSPTENLAVEWRLDSVKGDTSGMT